MPYREAPIRELCSECSAIAKKKCKHCNRPLCWLHNMPWSLCKSCVSSVRRSQRRMHPLFFAAALVTALGGMMIVTLGIISLAVFGVFIVLVESAGEAASSLVFLFGQEWKSHPLTIAALVTITPALVFKLLHAVARRRIRGFYDV